MGPRSKKRGRPKTLDGKINYKKLDLTRMVEMHVDGLEGNGLPYSMASFKELMASTYIAKLIFDKCRNMPNRKLISHTIKELFGWQRKAA